MKQGNGKTEFQPYIKAEQKIPEATVRAVILGALLAVVFGVANAYLGLKVGMTVSASIPAAVMSMAILRGILRKGTVLENNIVQTIASSGESLAAGIIFTIPAFFIWNLTVPGFHHPVTSWEIFFLSLMGGFLGILFVIPLRRYLMVHEHGKLKFPEGTACAEIIKAGDEGGVRAKTVFAGMGLGALYKLIMGGLRLWPEIPNQDIHSYKGANVGIDATPALLGVGYIIGPRISALMLGGAVLGYLGIAPLIAYLGAHTTNIVPPATKLITEMTPDEIRNNYIKYLGVGAVLLGGFITLFKSLPVIFNSFGIAVKEIFGKKEEAGTRPRTDQDLPMWFVLVGVLVAIIAIWLFPGANLHLLGTILVVIFGFFFVVVAARIVGIVGSSSSPVSGMTIATLLVTSLILLSFGVSGLSGMVTVMFIGTIVCIAVCMSGDISQDLKTGYLLGATPKNQQLMEFVGLIFPALIMGFTVFLLNNAFGFVKDATHPAPLLAPQANVMAAIVQGVMTGNLPWIYVIVGAMLALTVELLGISSLPFSIGLYLPLNLSTPIMAGGLISWIVRKTSANEDVGKKREEEGILLASGLIAGDALVGVLIAFAMALPIGYRAFYEGHEAASLTGNYGPWLSLAAFAVMAFMLYQSTRIKKQNG
ncbi:MAG: oligopeptide transporter, OPT family [candidate division Zixibacteria bacterium]|nr:oligopeptide transporter, OPT family [candidate division Zixibacteria bacterium]